MLRTQNPLFLCLLREDLCGTTEPCLTVLRAGGHNSLAPPQASGHPRLQSQSRRITMLSSKEKLSLFNFLWLSLVNLKNIQKKMEKGPWQLKTSSLLTSKNQGPPVLTPSSATATSQPLCGASLPKGGWYLPARASFLRRKSRGE